MKKRGTSIWSIFAVCLSLAIVGQVSAQTESVSSTDATTTTEVVTSTEVTVTTTDTNTSSSPETTTSSTVSSSTSNTTTDTGSSSSTRGEESSRQAPGAFGLWWRGLRERVVLFTTLDPVKKAEKQIEFANDRIAIAEKLAAQSQNPKIAARTQAIIERANELIKSVEEKKDVLEQMPGVRAGMLLKNIARNAEAREHVLDRVEERLPEDKRQAFQMKREALTADGQKTLQALIERTTSSSLKEELQALQTQIQAASAAKKSFQEQHKELIQKAVTGDEAAKAQLETLREERKQVEEEMRESVKQLKEQIKDTVKELKKDQDGVDERMVSGTVRVRELGDDRREDRREDRRDGRMMNSSTRSIDDRMEEKDRTRIEAQKKESNIPVLRALERAKEIERRAEEEKKRAEQEMEDDKIRLEQRIEIQQ